MTRIEMMIVPGPILLIAPSSILWTIGLTVLMIGIVLLVAGEMGSRHVWRHKCRHW
jgi:hypothetical protein